MKKIIGALIAVLMILVIVTPVLAGDGNNERRSKGDKIAIEGGYEATYQGLTADKKHEVWAADLSAPKYLPNDLETPINCEWQWDDKKGEWHIPDNLFTAEVKGTKVTVHYEGQDFTFDPVVYVGKNDKYYAVDDLAKQLGNDPINSHLMYVGNTLEWDYGICTRHLRVIEGELLEYFIFDKDPQADVQIKYKYISKDKDFQWEVTPCAWDANGKSIVIDGAKNVKASEFARDDITYPVTIDPTTTFYISASDGSMNRNLGSTVPTWNTVHDNATALYSSSADIYCIVSAMGYYYVPSNTYNSSIDRAGLYFDTSAIPDVNQILLVTLDIYLYSLTTGFGAWTLRIQSGMPTYPHDPMVVGDYYYIRYDGAGGDLATGDMVLDEY